MDIDYEQLRYLVKNKDFKALQSFISNTCKTPTTQQCFHSYLMLSAHNIKHLSKINQLECDCIMLNLEDGVSHEQKPFALLLSQIILPSVDSRYAVVVRVNPLDEGGIEEIKSLNAFKPDAIRVPKIQTAQDVALALEMIDEGIELHLSIETKEAFHNLNSLIIDKRVTTCYLGMIDLLVSMNLPYNLLTYNNDMVRYLIVEFLYRCRVAGVKPVGFTYQYHTQNETFKRWCAYEHSLGYDAKSCISPQQVAIANSTYKVSDAMYEKAKKIVKLYEQHQKLGVVGFDAKELGFIDAPIYKDALNTIRRYRACLKLS
ncbi:MAG: HpcH/HpaI aldolase/citrate lyase family protein [Campylobacterota bacterium]